ncbi:UDP-galactopyranose/dTDP-fucopyranose mutase family protein [Frigidibacter sp. ROC022]|uniref:UDP-galactopyranose/dTDP-fucopyranose mutase family protein n=1 Tax=Frigidibacter sp. ROC022 TaxID=2971796 RepID=UPI00215B2781|nr:UDP-galactopyranose mutase [Frigidibacter sp. ROC022]MCR8726822.1 NAD(P)-binding protein [Frigidibacter sp. ROC022]
MAGPGTTADPGGILVAGAGLSGAVIARCLAEAGLRVQVVEARDHVAGNCHTERDPETGVMVHRYGPHIFHTEKAPVWDFVNRFARFMPYRHRVRTTVGGEVYALPVNLGTINQFFRRAMRPDEARAFVAGLTETGDGPPRNFEEQALAMIGADLYRAFFKSYTEKQWGTPPALLPAAILKRLPLRFSYDDSYFSHRFQGIPEQGYTAMVTAMLDHPGITLQLGRALRREDTAGAEQVFWSGPLDGWFGHRLGRLGYRTLDFEHFTATGDWQGCPVMNYGDPEVPWTRITEHKHFAPWEEHAATFCSRETSRACGPDDIPYYPIRLVREKALLADYLALAGAERGVTFVGRLGSYRYLDMDQCIEEAMEVARRYLEARRQGRPLPAFVHSPV